MTYEECLKIFGIRDVQDLPRAALEVVLGEEEWRHDVYRELLRVNDYDVGRDWFQEIYEAEMSEGKRKGQHFTPPEIYHLVSMLADIGNGEETSVPTTGADGDGSGEEKSVPTELGGGVRRVHEPTAGTGGLILGDWWRKCTGVNPWRWQPWKNVYVAWELSDRAVPLLLLNMSIRGIHGVVYHGDVLEKTVYAKYIVYNETNNPIGFSKVKRVTPEEL